MCPKFILKVLQKQTGFWITKSVNEKLLRPGGGGLPPPGLPGPKENRRVEKDKAVKETIKFRYFDHFTISLNRKIFLKGSISWSLGPKHNRGRWSRSIRTGATKPSKGGSR